MANPILSDPDFQAWSALPGRGDYRAITSADEWWSSVGRCRADERFTALADLYLKADAERQQTLRDYFADQTADLDEMTLYVRRVGKLIASKDDTRWLERGLAIAAIEGGRIDYRDTIVSLVLLRYGAERVGIDTAPFFDRAMQGADPDSHHTFQNARDHAAEDVAYTVEEDGPPEWADEVQRQGHAQ